ncbi:nif11-class peptide radical SAM maturase 3 [Crocosphaera sp. XPORK-15E]|uniref:nif11-class peptide radical SAM maturase 3 n=1 Tax=Crocosphaera sp. XPORK-15E TaxID=3110247 RepID=UPI002B211664|nr:nif11-class peptide radical SAM maturase 3 [Crocosphaera sp. XPORK-15E]MEA5535811.1 nif11-class peptide radical SAM maturase 3 [Crocosphaera sp. XPORK-15E]
MTEYRRISYAVWEITLKCNLACQHCGSRAGHNRTEELSTEEALNLVEQMAEVGIKEVTIIGGEAFLRPDWLEIAKAINKAGMVCGMTTGGYGITLETAHRMKEAGIKVVSVSVDGLEETHDYQRGKQGSWQWAFKTMSHLKEAGIAFGCNTQINRLSAPEFPLIYERLRDAGIFAWQIQLTVPMGRAADNNHILLQPYELLDVYPMIAKVAQRAKQEGVKVQAGNNIGYYGPYERLLRGGDAWSFWQGCSAGLSTLGIEADGAIKGCPSLPTTAYTGGNIRDYSLRTIIEETEELRFNLGAGTPQGTDHLWGFCKTCEFAELCRGGCSWTAHVFFDKRGNNPYCHHRALTQEKQEIRERVVLKHQASGNPFDNGVFELIEEPFNSPLPEDDKLQFTANKIQWPASWEKEEDKTLSLVGSSY